MDHRRLEEQHAAHRLTWGEAGDRATRAPAAPSARSSFVLPGTSRTYERSRPFLVEHIALDWRLDFTARAIDAVARLTIRRVDPDADELVLDAEELAIDRTELRSLERARPTGGRERRAGRWTAAAAVHDGAELRVAVGRSLTRLELRVRYRARPVRGLYFLAPDEAVPSRPRQIWTQCQDEDARRLFPCHDKPHMRQTFEIDVRVEPGWTAISNGRLLSSRAEQRRGRFRYRMSEPIPSYLFSLVAGEFDCIEARARRVPLAYYVPKGRAAEAKRAFARTPDMVQLYEQKTGVRYPFGRYAQVVVHDFIFGGMENAGVTTLYEYVLLDERAARDIDSDTLISHELAHQWFGDLVTCRDWSHGWLNEGFATFMEHVYREHHLGRDEYYQALRDDLRAYLAEAAGRYRRPVVCHDYEVPIDVFDRHLYEKGGLVIHALRSTLGESAFWQGVHRYLTTHAGGMVETRDLQRALESTSGRSLEALFDQYLLRAGHPELDVSVAYESSVLTVTVKQSLGADEPAWQLDLDLAIARPAAATARRGTARPRASRGTSPAPVAIDHKLVRLGKPVETFAFACPERPRFVLVDPDQRIVGKITVQAPLDMVRAQLESAPTARAAARAAEQLGRRGDLQSVGALGRVLASGRAFWGLRATAAAALGAIRSPDARDVLLGAATVRHSKVRRAVATALGAFREPAVAARLARLAERDPSYLVAAAACRALGATRQPAAFDKLVSLLDRPSWSDILRAAAIDGLAALRDERAVPIVQERTRYGIPSRGRRAAIAALASLTTERAAREHIEQLLEAEMPMVRMSAVEALGEIADVRSRGALERALGRERDGRVRRRIRELLRDLGARGRAEVRRLRDDLSELERKLAELAAKVAKLGAGRDRTSQRDRARRRKGTRRR